MPEINSNNNPAYNSVTGTPLYNYVNSYQAPQGQTVNVTAPNAQNITSPIYQYPSSSLYAPQGSSIYQSTTAAPANGKETSGVNIYIYNPTGLGGPSSSSSATASYGVVPQQTTSAASAIPTQNAQQTVANTPISEEKNQTYTPQRTKKIVDLTDDYVKTLESYLRSDDKSIRRMGIQELIKRFEEDDSRYDDKALTALLNIALQDKDASNRILAMSPVAAASAHGDDNTIALLQKLQSSDKVFGQEAKMATDALLKSSQSVKSIPDYSSPKTESEDDEEKN